jgi:hypothetical protein
MNSENNTSTPQVLVYRHPNPEIRSFLTPKAISSYRVEYFKRDFFDQSEASVKSLGLIGEHAVRELMALPGIEEIHIKPREVWIKKSTATAWDDIEDKIIQILKRALRKKEIVRVK